MLRLHSDTFPRNITLSQKEYKEIYPNQVPRRITFLFGKKLGNTIPMKDEIAYYIVNHYDVKVVGTDGKILDVKDELDGMKRQDILKLCAKYNRVVEDKINVVAIKTEDAKTNIRKWRLDGVKL